MDDSSSRINSFVENDSILDDTTATANMSFDCNGIKLKLYEEQISKLIVENKHLRNQLSGLAEDTREQEEKFMKVFNEASEERRQQDERVQQKHKALLQQYYEAFVQLENENKALKQNLYDALEKLKLCDTDTDKSESYKPDEKKTKIEQINVSPSQISLTILTEKDAEIQELKQIVERLKEENETLNSMKSYFNEKTKVCDVRIDDEASSKANNMESEKNQLANKLKNIEASLTRWIFKACDTQTELERYKNDNRNLNEQNKRLNDFIQNVNESQYKLEQMTQKYEDEVKKSCKLQLIIDESKDEIHRLNDTIAKQKMELEKLKHDLKNEDKRHSNDISNMKTKISELNELIKQKDTRIGILESAKDDAQTLECELKLRAYENKSTVHKLNQMNQQLNENTRHLDELKRENGRLKSDHDTLNQKIKLLTSENQVLKTKFDSNLLEKNSLKCKYEELLRETSSKTQVNSTKPLPTIVKQMHVKIQTEKAPTKELHIQTDDFNYDLIILPIKELYENKIKEYIHNEILSKNELEQLKYRLKKNEDRMTQVNDSLKEQFKLNAEMRERNDYLMDKCSKLKQENDAQLKEFGKIRLNYEYDREVLESTVSQQKKVFDHIANTYPDLIKKMMKK